MKKSIVSLLCVAICIIIAVANVVPSVSSESSVAKPETVVSNDVVTVANSQNNQVDVSKISESRFLNMLNHNYLYGEAFNYEDEIVNNAVIALLDLRDSEDEAYIAENYVADYIFNMYGVEISSFAGINAEFPQKQGYVYIIPRGFSLYEHKMVSATENEDGSFTVKTKVTVFSHDGLEKTEFCTSLFVKNADSSFGYSLISSNIGGDSLAV